MSDSEIMQPLEKGKLDPKMARLVRNTEMAWQSEAKQQHLLRRRSRFVGWAIGLSVIGIYVYTITSFKQETFLSELDKRIVNASRSKDDK